MMALLYEAETYKIIGASFEVYREMGCGFLEAVYHECLEMEFALQQVPHESRSKLRLTYKSQPLVQYYEPDFVCFQKIIVELKAAKELCDEHRAQVHNYLVATGLRLGLLLNFGHFPKLEYERIIH